MNPLRCTVIDALAPTRAVDLDVRAPLGAVFGDVTGQLLRVAGLDPTRALSISGRPLDPDLPLGRPPLLDGVLLVALPSGPALPAPAGESEVGAVLELCVVAGPDAGHRLPLRPGRYTVGRGDGATLLVDDRELSRQHLAVRVGPDGGAVEDLGSTNGTWLDGERVPAGGVPVRPGQRITAGATALVIRVADAPLASANPTAEGTVRVNRAPRSTPTVEPVVVRRPPAPAPPPPARFPWTALLVPVVLCVPMALLFHQPSYLAFGLIGPLAMAATTLVERRGRRQQGRREGQEWQVGDDRAAERTRAALVAELGQRRLLAGDAAELLCTARGPGRRLWERGATDDDLLDVTLGSAGCRSQVRVAGGVPTDDPERERQWLDDAPLTVRLDTVQHLGLAGDGDRVTAVARYLLGQLAIRSTPRAVQLVTPEEQAKWSWARWLPHHVRLTAAELDVEVSRRRTQAMTAHRTADGSARGSGRGSAPGPWPRMVVLLDLRTGTPSSATALAAALRHGPAVGVHVICLADELAQLPSACGLTVDLPANARAQLRHRDGTGVRDLAADGVGAGWVQDVARALAPLRDATPEPDEVAALPARVGLSPLLGVDPADAKALADRWRRGPRSTLMTLGAGRDGPAVVDLLVDGPHVLVAGTTGSGKSELLQTMVSSLALGNRPDELAFVLVDYKGGAAFQRCAELPHVVGLVTDLDTQLAGRALTSLQAELTRREHLLSSAGVADLGGYQRWRDAHPDQPRLARLVLVIDEFRMLAGELPDFLDGLVRLAAVGRSLGVHLVLATQRPAGIVSADIKANVNLRICLRVRDRIDSDDVLDAPDAAALPDATPGRGLFRSGSGALAAFQAALAGGTEADQPATEVLVLPAGQAAPTGRGPDHLAALVRATRSASEGIGAQPPPSPWLPPLPDVLPLVLGRPDEVRTSGLELGRVDLPSLGLQQPFTWDPRTGSHLAVSGASRSGRTTALLAVAAAALSGGPDCHLHVVDAAGGALSRALDSTLDGTRTARLGTVLSADCPRTVARLVDRLTEQLRAPGPSKDERTTLLLVDGWEALAEALEAVDHGRALDDLLTLVRDGEPAGLRLVVAGGRGVLMSRISALVGQRLLLRPNDPTDLLLAGVPSARTPLRQPPGRAIHLPSGAEVQLGWPGDPDRLREGIVAARVDPDGSVGRAPDGRATGTGSPSEPLRLRALPASVQLSVLASEGPTGPGHSVLVGVGGDEATPLWLDLAEHRRLVVCGPSGSGRSHTLALLAQQLHGRGARVLAVSPHDGQLRRGDWDCWAAGTDDPVAALRSWLSDGSSRTSWVLVDDVADLVHQPGLMAALDQVTQGPADCGVVLCGRTDDLRGSPGPLMATAARHRTGILLQPRSPHDGEAFGVRAESVEPGIPGRGLLVVRGRVSPLQVAR